MPFKAVYSQVRASLGAILVNVAQLEITFPQNLCLDHGRRNRKSENWKKGKEEVQDTDY